MQCYSLHYACRTVIDRQNVNTLSVTLTYHPSLSSSPPFSPHPSFTILTLPSSSSSLTYHPRPSLITLIPHLSHSPFTYHPHPSPSPITLTHHPHPSPSPFPHHPHLPLITHHPSLITLTPHKVVQEHCCFVWFHVHIDLVRRELEEEATHWTATTHWSG